MVILETLWPSDVIWAVIAMQWNLFNKQKNAVCLQNEWDEMTKQSMCHKWDWSMCSKWGVIMAYKDAAADNWLRHKDGRNPSASNRSNFFSFEKKNRR